MQTTTARAFLIIARYNHSKRNKLLDMLVPEQARQVAEYQSEGDLNASAPEVDEHEQARQAAEELFPYEHDGMARLREEGVQMVHTFDSAFCHQVPAGYRRMPIADKLGIAASVIRKLGEDNLGIGWMAVVDAAHFLWFVEQMSGHGTGSGLWQVFDVEIVPLQAGWMENDVHTRVPALNDDTTTADIYEDMTPVSWGK